MNNDLISRKALIEAYDKAHKGPPGGARKLMEEAPGVDAVVLPCKVGDKIYKLWSCGKNGKAVAEFEITHIDIDYLPEIEFAFRKPKGTGYYYFAKVGEIGKTVFLTREEAEAALAKMDGERKEK